MNHDSWRINHRKQKNITHNVSHDLKQEKFAVDNVNYDMNKTKSGVYKIQIYVRKKIGIYTASKYTLGKKCVYNVKICIK